jgi:hypothetical protein
MLVAWIVILVGSLLGLAALVGAVLLWLTGRDDLPAREE